MSDKEQIKTGSFHSSDFSITSYKTVVTEQKLSGTSAGKGETTFKCNSIHDHFVADVSAVFKFSDIACEDPEHTVSFVSGYYDKLVTKAVFSHKPSGVNIEMDRDSIVLSNNFIGSRGELEQKEKSNFIEAHNVKLPLMFPFSNCNDGAFPIIFSPDDTGGSRFEVTITPVDIEDILLVWDADGNRIPYSDKLFKGVLSITLSAKSNIRREPDNIEDHWKTLPREIHYAVMRPVDTSNDAITKWDCKAEGTRGSILALFWKIDKMDARGNLLELTSEPMLNCSIKGVDKYYDEAAPEELRQFPRKYGTPYKKYGVYCAPLSVKPIRNRSCHPLRGNDTNFVDLSINLKPEKGIKYNISVYSLKSSTLKITNVGTETNKKVEYEWSTSSV